jgi:hypothetical protein
MYERASIMSISISRVAIQRGNPASGLATTTPNAKTRAEDVYGLCSSI